MSIATVVRHCLLQCPLEDPGVWLLKRSPPMWVHDIGGPLAIQVLIEYTHVWEVAEGTVLIEGVPKTLRWCWANDELYYVE
jgi:hypothetical protein